MDKWTRRVFAPFVLTFAAVAILLAITILVLEYGIDAEDTARQISHYTLYTLLLGLGLVLSPPVWWVFASWWALRKLRPLLPGSTQALKALQTYGLAAFLWGTPPAPPFTSNRVSPSGNE